MAHLLEALLLALLLALLEALCEAPVAEGVEVVKHVSDLQQVIEGFIGEGGPAVRQDTMEEDKKSTPQGKLGRVRLREGVELIKEREQRALRGLGAALHGEE